MWFQIFHNDDQPRAPFPAAEAVRRLALVLNQRQSLCEKQKKKKAMTSKIAVAQLTSTADVARNTARCLALIAQAAAGRAQCVFLPEASDYIAEHGKDESIALAQPLNGSFVTAVRAAAREHAVWVSVGVHEKPAQQDDDDGKDMRFFNTHLLIDTQGQIARSYRKVHLFDVSIANGPQLRESDAVRAGSDLGGAPAATPFGRVGLQICYDLRFPEQARHQRALGADVLTYPSAFTVPTGRAHWEILLRARAIENQAYVVAAAQVGLHNPRRESYGHALVVDPWGAVIAHCTSQDDEIAFADLDAALIAKTRAEMPVFSHRRLDLYPQPSSDIL